MTVSGAIGANAGGSSGPVLRTCGDSAHRTSDGSLIWATIPVAGLSVARLTAGPAAAVVSAGGARAEPVVPSGLAVSARSRMSTVVPPSASVLTTWKTRSPEPTVVRLVT